MAESLRLARTHATALISQGRGSGCVAEPRRHKRSGVSISRRPPGQTRAIAVCVWTTPRSHPIPMCN